MVRLNRRSPKAPPSAPGVLGRTGRHRAPARFPMWLRHEPPVEDLSPPPSPDPSATGQTPA